MPTKISVIGDVMTEYELLSTLKKEDGSYDYDPVFLPLKGLLSESDFRIANLETPVAGEDLGYSPNYYSFNAPESLVTALQKIGIDAVSTANNHAADRKGEGFRRTIASLDRLGMPHTGTYLDPEEKNRNLYFTVGGTRFAMIAYTYGVNGWGALKPEEGLKDTMVNLLTSPKDKRVAPTPKYFSDAIQYIEERTGYTFDWTEKVVLKKLFKVPVPYPDDFSHESSGPYLERLKEDYNEARKHADVVLFVPHVGGQFNTEPGALSKYLIGKAVEMGFDVVTAAHSHTTQMAEWCGHCPTFYSLGNVSMSARTPYAQPQTLPNFGLVAHLYVDGGKIVRSSYSIFKIVEDGDENMRVVPVDELYAELKDADKKAALVSDVASVALRVSGFTADGADVIRREYELNA